MKELKKIWRGVAFLKRTNSKHLFVIASYHHPDSITWRWSFYVSIDPRIRKMRFGREFGRDFGLYFNMPFVGSFSIQTQTHMFRRNLT